VNGILFYGKILKLKVDLGTSAKSDGFYMIGQCSDFLNTKKCDPMSRLLDIFQTTTKMKDLTRQGIVLQFHRQIQTQLPWH
jgi:hypothetical protein